MFGRKVLRYFPKGEKVQAQSFLWMDTRGPKAEQKVLKEKESDANFYMSIPLFRVE